MNTFQSLSVAHLERSVKKAPGKGILFVISAPSGAGKTTLAGELFKAMPEISYSVSVTTRPPRKGEKEGQDYIFITEDKFKKIQRSGELIESACVHGFWYGTPKTPIRDHLRLGRDMLLDIDVQGGKQIKKIFPDAVLVFIAPPSIKVLEQRLRSRNQDDAATIQRRLAGAIRELSEYCHYDYMIVNDEISRAVAQLKSIVDAERIKVFRKRVNAESIKGVRKRI
jgi:guanylate kinase